MNAQIERYASRKDGCRSYWFRVRVKVKKRRVKLLWVNQDVPKLLQFLLQIIRFHLTFPVLFAAFLEVVVMVVALVRVDLLAVTGCVAFADGRVVVGMCCSPLVNVAFVQFVLGCHFFVPIYIRDICLCRFSPFTESD